MSREEKIAQLQNQIDESESSIERCDDEIKSLQSKISDLNWRKESYQKAFDEATELLSFITPELK
jgi:chromosome segregation ATPase